MSKRILSLLLCAAMLVGICPAVSFAAEEAPVDFLLVVDQLTWEDRLPEGYLPISSEDDLEAILNEPDGLYILMEDIEIETFEPLSSAALPFAGVLEGNGHTISGVTVSVTCEKNKDVCVGLFPYIEDARIANLRVEGSVDVQSNVKTKSAYVGGLVGLAMGNVHIVNCVNAVEIYRGPLDETLKQGTGGLVGCYQGNTGDEAYFDSCLNGMPVTSVHETGGIIGRANLTGGYLSVKNSRNRGKIDLSGSQNPYAESAGGIIGSIDAENNAQYLIQACMNEGEVIVPSTAGGIVGMISCSESSGRIAECANTARVYASKRTAGGIAGYGGQTEFTDCLNTGRIEVGNINSECAGIAAFGYGTAERCVNTGKISEGDYCSGIQATVFCETKAEALEMLKNCYWLDDGTTNTLFRSTFWGAGDLLVTTGKLSADAMKKEESFSSFTFPDTWTMVAEMGHPFPTALLNTDVRNKYYTQYVENTRGAVDTSEFYTEIMAGTGDGSLAGELGAAYSATALDEVNGIWERMQFVEALANYQIPTVTDYDVLLGDLIAGTISRDIRNSHITTTVLELTSELTSLCGTGLKAVEAIATENKLAKMADIHTLFGGETVALMDEVRNSVLKDLPYERFSKLLEGFGGVVNITQAVAAGCETTWDTWEYYVMCNAYSKTMALLKDLIVDAAEEAYLKDSDEGYDLLQSAWDFEDRVQQILMENPEALYEGSGRTLGNLASVSGFTILETVMKLKELSPVLNVIDDIKGGITVGMPIADYLTNMDKIAYNGRMLQLCSTFAKGLHAEVLELKEIFTYTQEFDDAQKLNMAGDLYLNTQILACEYAIGYSQAIASNILAQGLRQDQDDLDAIVELQKCKERLEAMKKSGYPVFVGEDGSIGGFIANCPVTITVTDAQGNVLTCMESGIITTVDSYGGNYRLLGDAGQRKAGLYDPLEHTVTITGEADGSMDLVVYGAEKGRLAFIDTYLQVPVSEGTTYIIRGNKLEGYPDVLPTYHEEITPVMEGVVRLSGSNRYQTGFSIANQLKEILGVEKFEAVVVAYGQNFPDALTGSYLASVKNAPILLTEPSQDANLLEYLRENLVSGGKVYILGGTAAVSDAFESGAKAFGFNVERMKGAGRYETNLEILKEAGVNDTDEVLIATGKNYADSLSASATGLPMLLVDKTLTDSQKAFLQNTSRKFVILGGTGAVSAEVEAELDAIGDVTRVKGASRYGTSVEIAKRFFTTPNAAVLAYAEGFPDGLCGGPLAYCIGAPLILTSNTSSALADAYVVGITSGAVTGGTGRITDETVRDIFDLPGNAQIVIP